MKIYSAIFSALILALLVTAAGAVVFQAAGSGSIGYWNLDETTGTVANDANGVNPLTYSGGPLPSTDIPAVMPAGTHSLSFDGVDDYVSKATLTGLAPGNTVHSIAGWIKVTALPTNRAWILQLGNEGGGSHHWLINSAGGTQFGTWGGPGQINPTLAVGAWTHVAITFDGTNLRGYVNGTLINSVATSFNLQGVPLSIAQAHNNENYFNGLLDDVRVYNRELTQPEITALAAGSFGPAAPTGLTATPGSGSVTLNWNALPSGTLYNVRMSTTSGGSPAGTYPLMASDIATNSYTVTGLTPGVTYYFVVSGVSYGEGPYSGEVPGKPLTVSALPNTGLFTSEVPTSTNFTIRFETAVPTGTTVTLTITSSDTSEGTVSDGVQASQGQIIVTVVGPQAANYPVPITVTGVNDFVIDPAQPYTVTVTTQSGNSMFDNVPIPPVNCINNDNDTAGITLSKTSGLVTTESGGQDTFSVSLRTSPSNDVTLNLLSSNTGEVTVSPSSITFNSGNWNTPIQVTVTGVDDQALDFTQPFTIVTLNLTSSDSNYSGLAVPDVTGVNIDNEAIPPAPRAWGGSGGGCGLLGLEIALPLALVGLHRRRRRL